MDNELKIKELENKVNELTIMLDSFKRDYAKHQHDNFDGTQTLTKDIKIGVNNFLDIGYSEHGSPIIKNIGATDEEIQYSISVNNDNSRGFSNALDGILQLNFFHYPNSTTKQSFINAFRSPIVTPNLGQTIDTTSGGNTVVISGFNFTTNKLAGALINIYNSSGVFIESKVIASNTSDTITITGTWGASTTGGLFQIYVPVYFGDGSTIWQRFYVQEGTGGGIRFGMGVTGTDGNPATNGLLYSDATGDLYWRNKSGTSTKLN